MSNQIEVIYAGNKFDGPGQGVPEEYLKAGKSYKVAGTWTGDKGAQYYHLEGFELVGSFICFRKEAFK